MSMKITRDGKVYELTANEMSLAYEEALRTIWRDSLNDAIERNSENLRFGEEFTVEEFVNECMEEMEDKWYADDWDERCDEVVFDIAQSYEVWADDPNEEDDGDDF